MYNFIQSASKKYECRQLPAERQLLETLSCVSQQQCCNMWPLLCDAERVGIFCLRKLRTDMVIVKYDVSNFCHSEIWCV